MFPAPAASAQTNNGTANPTLAASLPSGISAGELLTLFVMMPGANNVSINTPSGWTAIAGVAQNPSSQCFAKIASGSEGSTVNLTTSNGASRQVWCLAERWGTSAHASTLPQGTQDTDGDLPSFNPSNWDVEDTHWRVAICATGGAGSAPSGYTSVYNPGGTMRVSGKDSAAASDDPGSVGSSGDTVGVIVAIRPAAVAPYVPQAVVV